MPIFWGSKLQTDIALSTREDECIALSTEMREVILQFKLLEDLKVSWDVITTLPTVTYKVFEDNQSCIAVAESKKLQARTKYAVIKYHHFKNLVDDKVIKISYIDTKK